MRTVLKKNLIAHKRKNRLTAIIYALSLGSIIFLLTSANLQIKLIVGFSTQASADLVVHGPRASFNDTYSVMLHASAVDDVIRQYSVSISDWSYKAEAARYANAEPRNTIGSLSRLSNESFWAIGVSPSDLFDSNIQTQYRTPNSALPLTEQLYTARGVQGLGIHNSLTKFGVDPANLDDLLELVEYRRENNAPDIAYEVRPLFTGKSMPNFIKNLSWGLIQLPMYTQITHSSMDQIVMRNIYIKMVNPEDNTLRAEIINALETALGEREGHNLYLEIIDQYALSQSSETTLNLLDSIFFIMIAIMMFLCFFALQGSMSANLYEQTKEIAVLRSIGFTSWRICVLYFYEALLLVLASCFLGIVIGVIVGMTMVMQQDLFLALDFQFYFPWKQTLEIFILSILCAVMSTFGPVYQLTRK